MFRKTLFGTGLAVVGIALLASMGGSGRSAAQADKSGARQAAPYVHTVIFHVKKDAPEGEVAALIRDAQELLRPIPSVRELRVGRPAEKSTPDLAKKDYQVGLQVLFDDAEGLDIYLKHPQHLKYVDKHLNHVDLEKLLVFDFMNQNK